MTIGPALLSIPARFVTVSRTLRRALLPACAALAPALLALPARAQDDPTSCKNPQTQTDINICTGREGDAEGRRMQAAYARVHAAQPAPAAALLDRAQAAWTAFRLRECDSRSTMFEGGSAQPMVLNECWSEVTGARANTFIHPPRALSESCAAAAAPARCAGGELAAADSAMNAAYRALRTATLKGDTKLSYPRDYDPSLRTRGDLLRSAQRAWIRWRDAQCAWEATGPHGGAAARTGCLARLTRLRAAELRDALRDEG